MFYPLPRNVTYTEITGYLAEHDWEIYDYDGNGQVQWHHPDTDVLVEVGEVDGDSHLDAQERLWTVLDDIAMGEYCLPEQVADTIAAAHRDKYHRHVIATRSRVTGFYLPSARLPATPIGVMAEVICAVEGLDIAAAAGRLIAAGWHEDVATGDLVTLTKTNVGAIQFPTRRHGGYIEAFAAAVYAAAHLEDRPVRQIVREVVGLHPHALLIPTEADLAAATQLYQNTLGGMATAKDSSNDTEIPYPVTLLEGVVASPVKGRALGVNCQVVPSGENSLAVATVRSRQTHTPSQHAVYKHRVDKLGLSGASWETSTTPRRSRDPTRRPAGRRHTADPRDQRRPRQRSLHRAGPAGGPGAAASRYRR